MCAGGLRQRGAVGQQRAQLTAVCGALTGGRLRGLNGLARIVPQREHRPSGNVARAAGRFIRLFAELQQRHQLVADSHRPGRRLCVDVGQVYQPVIARIDVKQLVAAQKVCVQRICLRLPFGFAGGVTGHDGHGVEQVHQVVLYSWGCVRSR